VFSFPDLLWLLIKFVNSTEPFSFILFSIILCIPSYRL
jgi:hypothetical protein